MIVSYVILILALELLPFVGVGDVLFVKDVWVVRDNGGADG